MALHEVMWCGAWLYGVHRMHWDSSSFMWHLPCNNQTALLIHHFGWYSKHAVKSNSHSFGITCDKSTVSAQERRTVLYKSNYQCPTDAGAGIAQWLEHRTRDWKVAGSNPCWNGGRIFFSRVDFLCWLLFRYPFHPRVTTVARKKSRSFCQKCRWQVTAKHAYTLRMWILLNRASALVTTCP